MPEPAQDERDLVRRMLAGEEHAFEEFFDGHFSRLYRFALARLGHDADAAEEVVQMTLCKAIPVLGTWRGEATLFTWLCTFCRHEISRHYRRQESEPRPIGLIEGSGAAGMNFETLVGMLDGGVVDEVHRREIVRVVQATLDDLPAKYGDVLEWKYIHGLSVAEIAARLRSSAKAVESLLTRARQAFRAAVSTVGGSGL